MQKKHIPFLTFLVFFFLTIPLSFINFSTDYATSVVPGWHTTILPPYFLMNIFISIIILLVTFAYWKLSRKQIFLDWIVFLVHVILTLPVILYIIYPVFFDKLFFSLFQQNESLNISVILMLILTPYILFLIGQV